MQDLREAINSGTVVGHTCQDQLNLPCPACTKADVLTMRRVWDAVVHWSGYGRPTSRSLCRARIYSNGLRAIVVLTQLKDNPGVSVTNDYERVANQLRTAILQFIPEDRFPGSVIWLEQDEERPQEIDLVSLLWDLPARLHSPKWCRLQASAIVKLGIDAEELVHASLA